MGFERNNEFQKGKENIEKGIKDALVKDEAEEKIFSKSRKINKPKKQYMMLNFYPNEKIKLKRLANQQGISVSQYIENYLATQQDPGSEWD